MPAKEYGITTTNDRKHINNYKKYLTSTLEAPFSMMIKNNLRIAVLRNNIVNVKSIIARSVVSESSTETDLREVTA